MAISGTHPNDFFTIWPADTFVYPLYTIKSIKDNIINFDIDYNFQYLIAGSKNEEKPIKILLLKEHKQKLKYFNGSLTVDQKNKMSFVFGINEKKTFALLEDDINKYSSLYSQVYPFPSIS